jgi:hypothetical protein
MDIQYEYSYMHSSPSHTAVCIYCFRPGGMLRPSRVAQPASASHLGALALIQAALPPSPSPSPLTPASPPH